MLACDLIELNQRWDKRSFLQPRTTIIDTLNDSYMLKRGGVLLLGSYTKTIVRPFIDRPQEGIVQFSVFQANKRSDKISNLIQKIFIQQKCLDLESLCLKFNKQVFQYCIRLSILTEDGNPIESLVDLINFMINDIKIPTNFLPSCYYFIKLGDVLLRDPVGIEEDGKETSFIAVLRSKNELIYFENYEKACNSNLLCNIIEYCAD